MAMTFTRFLYLSISFSNVASLNLDATYWADVVFDRVAVYAANGCFERHLTTWVLIFMSKLALILVSENL